MLSVAELQLRGIEVVVTLPTASPPGAAGGWLSAAVGAPAGEGTSGSGSGGGASPLSLSSGSGPAQAAVVTKKRVRPERRPRLSRARTVRRYWVSHASVEKVNRRPPTRATRRPATNRPARGRPEGG